LAGREERVEKQLVELGSLGMEDLRKFLAKRLGPNPAVTRTVSGRYRFQVPVHRRLETDRCGVSTGLVGSQRPQELGTD
jgi:hypothetical protein